MNITSHTISSTQHTYTMKNLIVFTMAFVAILFTSCATQTKMTMQKGKIVHPLNNNSQSQAEFASMDEDVETILLKRQIEREMAKASASMNFTKEKGWEKIVNEAKKEDKLIFLDFYADYCAPCKTFDKSTLSNKKVISYMNENYINYKVDTQDFDGFVLSELYEVKHLPTLIILDTEGNVLARTEGVASVNEMLTMSKNAKSDAEAVALANKEPFKK